MEGTYKATAMRMGIVNSPVDGPLRWCKHWQKDIEVTISKHFQVYSRLSWIGRKVRTIVILGSGPRPYTRCARVPTNLINK